MTWKKNKEIILILSFVVAMAGIYYLVSQYLLKGIDEMRNNLQRLVAVHEVQREKLDNLSVLRDDFATISRDEEKIRPLLEQGNEIELIKELEGLAERSGNKVSIEVVPTAPVAKGQTKVETDALLVKLPVKSYVQLKVKISGSFFNLVKFLNMLEHSKYYLDVIALQIAANQESTNSIAAPTTRNPFAGTVQADQATIGSDKGVVSVINVVVYTQN
ncbi:hypothetical protein EPO05_00905 [Patescibacteria group bacterium]|nr:MAG: hypothetical protein EPO05_00905 [Patescibacteria group bacterium]